jgi:hypothetical protein
MLINKSETHDRYLKIQEEQDVIQKGFEDCKYRNPLALDLLQYSNYIYIFAHKREVGLDEKVTKFNDDLNKSLIDPYYKRKYVTLSDIPSFRILWDPRLTKPDPQTNSYLFRTLRDSNDVEVYWILPPQELFGQHKKGNMIQDDIITESIHKYLNNREEMSAPHPEDLPLEKVKEIFEMVCTKEKKKEFKPILEQNSAKNYGGLILP